MQHARGKCDRKLYEYFTLQNGLEVLLVSNKNTNVNHVTAAAAMCIGSGSFCDPPMIQGLAHFTEHMLFMGSDKYPGENHYDEFVSSNGGQCNACTEGEYTLYNFDINVTKFAKALDIFANCFISPSFCNSSVDKELRAIESEFQLAKMSESTRYEQLLCQSTSADHPLRRFSWGNMNSLNKVPQAAGIDVVEAMRKYHKQYYHPRNAKLVIVAPLDLSELTAMVADSFCSWEPDSSAAPPPLLPVPTFPPHMLCVKPVKRNTHVLHASWIISPSTMQDYRSKSVEYIGHLLGHEGEGSLLQHLKECGYANNITAGVRGYCVVL